jgi:catechol 2,3-dioxygenase-like lactoylglutathione lyase family enzyme
LLNHTVQPLFFAPPIIRPISEKTIHHTKKSLGIFCILLHGFVFLQDLTFQNRSVIIEIDHFVHGRTRMRKRWPHRLFPQVRERMMTMQLKPLHVGISVTDMEQALAWYQDNLGFRLVQDDGWVPGLDARVCFAENNGFQVELFQYRDPIPQSADRNHPNLDLRTIGTKHVAFGVDDLASVRARLLENGVDIAHEVTMGQDRILFIRDCCGTLIELIEKHP